MYQTMINSDRYRGHNRHKSKMEYNNNAKNIDTLDPNLLSKESNEPIEWDVSPIHDSSSLKSSVQRRKSTGDIGLRKNKNKPGLRLNLNDLETQNMSEMEVVRLARTKSLEDNFTREKLKQIELNLKQQPNVLLDADKNTKTLSFLDSEERFSEEKPKSWANIVEKSVFVDENEELLHELPYDYDKFDKELEIKAGWRKKLDVFSDKLNLNLNRFSPKLSLKQLKPSINVNNLNSDSLKDSVESVKQSIMNWKDWKNDWSDWNLDSMKENWKLFLEELDSDIKPKLQQTLDQTKQTINNTLNNNNNMTHNEEEKGEEEEKDMSPIGLNGIPELSEQNKSSTQFSPRTSHKRKQLELSSKSIEQDESSALEPKKQRISVLLERVANDPVIGMSRSSLEMVKSFGVHYVESWKHFIKAFTQHPSKILPIFTGILTFLHVLAPLLFLDHSTSYSILKTFLISSFLSHIAYYWTGSLRSMFLSHWIYIPLLIKLIPQAFLTSTLTETVHSLYTAANSWFGLSLIRTPYLLHSIAYVNWLQLVCLVDIMMLVFDCANIVQVLERVKKRKDQGKPIDKSVMRE